jgi:hypothetical protein
VRAVKTGVSTLFAGTINLMLINSSFRFTGMAALHDAFAKEGVVSFIDLFFSEE